MDTRNHLLLAMPPDDRADIAGSLERVRLRPGDDLYRTGDEIDHVYFPEDGQISIVSDFADGVSVETAAIGHEGMVGLAVFLGARQEHLRTVVQVPTQARRLGCNEFLRVAHRPPNDTLFRAFTHEVMLQIAHSAGCNARHSVRQRCARWLLLTADRVGCDSFHVTHDVLAQMLAIHRPSATLAVGALRDDGLVRHSPGFIEILDRRGLEDTSCECYGTMRDLFCSQARAPNV